MFFSYDVDSIKNYVFSSSEFKAIIGASKLVSDFDVIANNFLENENSYVIHAVGGTGLAIVLSEELHRIEQELIKAFEENVPGGFFNYFFCRFLSFGINLWTKKKKN